jgi:hypothetical protein
MYKCLLPIMDRFRRLYKWENSVRMTRRAVPTDDHTLRIPQTHGEQGWLILHRTPTPTVTCVTKSHMEGENLPYVIDERCFDDCIFRIEKTADTIYLADIWLWQGRLVFSTETFTQRQQRIEDFLKLCYTPCRAFERYTLRLRKDAPAPYKGYEYYTDTKGEVALFYEKNLHVTNYEVKKTNLPDVYEVVGEGGYVNVQTLAQSCYLRSLGEQFKLPLRKEGDFWEIEKTIA